MASPTAPRRSKRKTRTYWRATTFAPDGMAVNGAVYDSLPELMRDARAVMLKGFRLSLYAQKMTRREWDAFGSNVKGNLLLWNLR